VAESEEALIEALVEAVRAEQWRCTSWIIPVRRAGICPLGFKAAATIKCHE
jgi:hypothetical protein